MGNFPNITIFLGYIENLSKILCKIINVVLYFNKTFKLLKAHNTPGPLQIRWMLIENKQLLFPCDLFEKSFTHSKIWLIFGWMYPIIGNMYVEYSSLALVIFNFQKFAKKASRFFIVPFIECLKFSLKAIFKLNFPQITKIPEWF